MLPLTEAVIEVRIVAHNAERALANLGTSPKHGDLEDHRTAALCELLDAFDRLDPGLGTRLMLALYPGTNGMQP